LFTFCFIEKKMNNAPPESDTSNSDQARQVYIKNILPRYKENIKFRKLTESILSKVYFTQLSQIKTNVSLESDFFKRFIDKLTEKNGQLYGRVMDFALRMFFENNVNSNPKNYSEEEIYDFDMSEKALSTHIGFAISTRNANNEANDILKELFEYPANFLESKNDQPIIHKVKTNNMKYCDFFAMIVYKLCEAIHLRLVADDMYEPLQALYEVPTFFNVINTQVQGTFGFGVSSLIYIKSIIDDNHNTIGNMKKVAPEITAQMIFSITGVFYTFVSFLLRMVTVNNETKIKEYFKYQEIEATDNVAARQNGIYKLSGTANVFGHGTIVKCFRDMFDGLFLSSNHDQLGIKETTQNPTDALLQALYDPANKSILCMTEPTALRLLSHVNDNKSLFCDNFKYYTSENGESINETALGFIKKYCDETLETMKEIIQYELDIVFMI